MIIEHVLLHIRPGQSAEFETAMEKARSLIAVSPGFLEIQVHAAIEKPDHYLMIVKWDDVDSHRDGFRRSDRYKKWRELLHGFYDPMPCVEYFGESFLNV